MRSEKNKRAVRPCTAAADLLLLLWGCVVAGASGAAGVVHGDFYAKSVEILSIIELCFFGLFVVIEVISVFTISDSTWHTVLVAVALLGFHLTGEDLLCALFGELTPLSVEIGDILHFLFFEAAALAVLYFWNYTFSLKFSQRDAAIAGAVAAAAFTVYAPLRFYGLEAIGFALFSLELSACIALAYRRAPSSKKTDRTFIASEALLYSVAGSALTDEFCAVLRVSSVGFSAFHALPLILVFLSVYAAFAMRTDRAALKASEYKLQYERVKARALKEQIKPHFIFNVLAAIQSLYRSSVDEGDRAVTLLAKHLRTNIEASDTDFIPFEKELDNVQVLVDLENMRLGKKVNVIYDIDYDDFEVPILSLQPYIENAIKYSRVNERENGFICISACLEGEDVLLAVTDNGVGFDPSKVKPTSCGIRNSSERFKMLMGVTPEIESAPGKGTSVRIRIKKGQRSAHFEHVSRRGRKERS